MSMRQIRPVTISVLSFAFLLSIILGSQSSKIRAQESTADLEQLVAPVALYPDELLAEVLAAATYPSDVDDAAQWLQQNASLTGDQVATAVDRMPWDDSVKGLTEFPSVLANLEQNLSWTSALGDAYANQPDDVMDAVQALRQRALAAGTLQSNAEVKVSTSDGIIVIEPADTNTVYVPEYDYWNGFGAPINPWPDFVFAAGYVRSPRVVWGTGFRVGGLWGRVNWGWHNWGFDWRSRRVQFHRQYYVSHSPTIIDRHYAPRLREPGGRPGVPPRGRLGAPTGGRGRSSGPVTQPTFPIAVPRAVPRTPADTRTTRGYPQAKPVAPPTGTHSGAMSGIGRGGSASTSSSRGQASMGARTAPPARAGAPPSPPPARARGRGRQ